MEEENNVKISFKIMECSNGETLSEDLKIEYFLDDNIGIEDIRPYIKLMNKIYTYENGKLQYNKYRLLDRLSDSHIVINCKTLDESKLFLKIINGWGVFTKVDMSWFANKEDTCYQIYFDKLAMSYIKICKNIRDYNQNFYEIWTFEKFTEEYLKEATRLYVDNRNKDIVNKMCEIDSMNLVPIEYLSNCLKS